jgi:hypothetical protein
MELHILVHNQRRLPCASLCLYTFAISTPDILLCKNRFLHVTSNMYTRAYKLMALHSQETNRNLHSNELLSQPNFTSAIFRQTVNFFLKKGRLRGRHRHTVTLKPLPANFGVLSARKRLYAL